MKHNLLTKLTIITILTILTNLVYAADKGNDPVAHWRFNEGGGPTAYDESSNNLDGTLTGTEGDEWTTGKTGSAISLDNGDDRVAISDPGTGSVIDFTTAVTLEAWVYRTDTPSSQARIVGKGDYYLLYTQGSNNKVNFYGSALSPNQLTANTALPLNEWAHVAATFGSGARKIYLNGKLDNSDTPTGSFGVDDGELTIGNYRSPAESYRFRGKIDDVKVYDYARTAAQIMVDYNAGSAAHLGDGVDPNEGNAPILYLPFDENTGTATYDKSGSGNNGTLTAGPTWVAGKHGSALSFDGSDDYVDITHYSFNGESVVTYCAFIKTSNASSRGASPSDTQHGLFSQLEDSSMQVGIDSGKPAIYYYNYTGTVWVKVWANTYVADDAWHHIAYILNTSTDKWSVYVDGVVDVDDETLTGLGQPWLDGIGKSRYQGRFDGLVDEVKIYDYARTQAQIAWDYNKGKPVAHYKFDSGTSYLALNEYSAGGSGGGDPVAWWRMDEGTGGTTADASGNGHTGTLYPVTGGTNTTTANMWDQTGKIGPDAIEFDGTDDYLTCTGGISTTDAITVEAWIKPGTISSLDSVYKIGGQSGTVGYHWLYISSSNMTWQYCHGDGYNAPGVSQTFSSGTWYHLALTHDYTAKQIKYYVDGVLIGTNNHSESVVAVDNKTSTIGAYSSTLHSFIGLIDDVRVYDYIRTAEQIYNDYNSSHGTLVGDTKFVDGKIGKALEFDGTGDYVALPGTYTMTDYSISFWFNMDASSGWRTFLGYSTGSSWEFNLQNDDKVNVYTCSQLTSTSALVDGQWYHIAVTHTASGTKLYIDGVFDNENATSNGALTGQTLQIGRWGTSQYLKGRLDDFRIYNYERTAAQIKFDYNAGAAFHPGGGTGEKDPWSGDLPVAHWKMDENTGVLAADASENGNDGTLGGDGAGTDVPAWTQGKHGSGLQFTDDHVKFLDSNNLDTGDYFTFEGWYNFSDLGFRSDIYFYNRNGQSGTSAFHIIWLNGASTIGYQYANGTSVVSKYSSSLSWSTGQWYHIAVTHDNVAKEIKYYRDGVYINTATYADNALNVTAGNAYLGGYQGDTRFRGKIDDVKLYNYVRTQAQIAWDYNKGKPVAHYRFNESSGTDAWDETTNNNATITIGATGSQTTIAAAHTNSATGKFGRCMSFDGSDDYATASSATAFDSTEWSVTAWVKIGTGDYQTLVSFNNGDLPRAQLSHGTYPLLYLNSGGDDYYRYGNLDIKDNKWHHVAFLFRDSDNYVKIFVDGIDRTGSGPNGNEASVTSTWRISDSSYTVNGLVDDVRVYNYVRTAEQLLLDYNAGAALRLGD